LTAKLNATIAPMSCPGDVDLVVSEVTNQGPDIGGHGLLVVPGCRLGRAALAAQLHGDHAMAFRQCRHDLVESCTPTVRFGRAVSGSWRRHWTRFASSVVGDDRVTPHHAGSLMDVRPISQTADINRHAVISVAPKADRIRGVSVHRPWWKDRGLLPTCPQPAELTPRLVRKPSDARASWIGREHDNRCQGSWGHVAQLGGLDQVGHCEAGTA